MTERTSEGLYAEIRDDDRRGASLIARTAARALALRARESDADSVDALAADLESFGTRLVEDKPSMASVLNVVEAILDELPDDEGTAPDRSVADVRQAVVDRAERLIERSESGLAAQAEYGANLIDDGDTVLMHSYSGSVLGVLREAADRGTEFDVVATESRPLYEGHASVAELTEAGIETTLIVDSAVGTYAADADLVLVGADSVLVDGTVVNKVGTLPLALSAAEHGVPVYVAVEVFKYDPRSLAGERARIEERPPEEVADPGEFDRPDLLTVENPFFEEVPPEHVDLLVTDEGVFPPASIHQFFEL